MAVIGQPTIYSIPIHRAFADALAAGVIARFDDGALGLAHGLILLPSNRARSAVQAAFVRAGGQGLLMPRLAVIGDADLDESVALALDAAPATFLVAVRALSERVGATFSSPLAADLRCVPAARASGPFRRTAFSPQISSRL